MVKAAFDWDAWKSAEKLEKHGVDFFLAQLAFADPQRVIAEDAGYWRKGKALYERENQIHR